MREVISVDENDLPNKPLSFALCTFARKFWFQVLLLFSLSLCICCAVRVLVQRATGHTAQCSTFNRATPQAATAEEKTEWTQAFSKFVLENLSSSLEQVDLTSSRSAQGL
jgi:hypothetical protein